MKLVLTSTMRFWEMDELKDFSTIFLVFSDVSEAHCESELHSLSPRAVETSVRFVKLKRGGSETVHIFTFSGETHLRTNFWCKACYQRIS